MDPTFINMLMLFFLISLIAGTVDSIAGGGGLLIIPALTLAGLDPIAALATSKLQAFFGITSASLTYHRHGLIGEVWTGKAFLSCLAGSILGSMLILQFSADLLLLIIPVLLILFAFYFLFASSLDQPVEKAKLSVFHHVYLLCPPIAFYDGFVGAGTGTFLTMLHRFGLGLDIRRAIAHAKPLNLACCIGSLIVLLFSGKAVLILGFVMGVGQIFGGYFGAKLANYFGAKLIRPLIVLVSLVLAGKILFDKMSSFF